MNIYIKLLSADGFTVTAEPSDTIEVVKYKIQDDQQYPADQQALVFTGKQLENQKKLGMV